MEMLTKICDFEHLNDHNLKDNLPVTLQTSFLATIYCTFKGPGGSPAVGGRELSWAYFNLKTVLTLPNYNII